MTESRPDPTPIAGVIGHNIVIEYPSHEAAMAAIEGPLCFATAHRVHPDAGNKERNHYDWFMPENPTGAVDGYLDDLEAKLTEALTDPFVHDMSQAVLPLIAAYRAARSSHSDVSAALATALDAFLDAADDEWTVREAAEFMAAHLRGDSR